MSAYRLNSIEEALAKCKADLDNRLSNASAYAFVFDAWLQQDCVMRPVLILQCESRESGVAMRFGHFYHIENDMHSKGTIIHPDGKLQIVGEQPAWLQ